MKKIFLGTILLLNFLSHAQCFITSSTSSAGANPRGINSADFNSDGNIDLAVANRGANNVSILLGSGAGTFASAVNYAVGLGPCSVATSDFNSDGVIDLAVCNINSSNISVLLGTGIGTFLTATNYPVGGSPNSIVNTDFNSDGKVDLAVTNGNTNNVSVLLGNGVGSFLTMVNYAVGLNPSGITTGDINSDGVEDLAVINGNSSNVSVLLGTGVGTFAIPVNYSVVGTPGSIATADFNGDGVADLVIQISSANNVAVLLGSGGGVFLSAINYTVSVPPSSITTSDLNGDGKVDLVVAGGSPNCVSVLYGSGTGSFAPAFDYVVGSVPISVIAADFNGDGKKDIATANYFSHDASVLLSTIPTISVNSGSICSGNSFTMNPVGASTYTYSSGGAVVSPTVNTTYSVIGTSSLGCVSSNTAVSSITVSPSPTLTVNSGNICIGESFTLIPSGAISYTYSSGSPVVSPMSNTTFTVSSSSVLGCIGFAVSTVTVNAAPILSFVGTNSVCIGSSTSFIANGASTYSWSTGAPTPSVSVSPTTTTTYSVVGTNTLGCTKTETISIIVNNTCQDVWPGDANSDGIANNIDVLELGLHIGQTGPNRSITSNLWQSYFSNNWVGTISGGKNVNHSDCNGDGTINQSDTLAIFNNYGLTHAFKPSNTSVVDPKLNIISDQSFVEKGKWGTASVYLGDAVNPINNVNGVAYTLNYDNSLIETDSVYLDYPVSFINAGNQNLHFRKRNFIGGVLYTATTHTTNNNVSGNGKIATVHFKIKSSLTIDAPLNFSIVQGYKSEVSGVITPLTVGATSVLAVGASVGLNTYDNLSTINIFPNPTNGILNIEVNLFNEDMNVMVYNALGQIVLTDVFTTKSLKLNTNALTNGIYFINVMSNNKTLTRSKFVKE